MRSDHSLRGEMKRSVTATFIGFAIPMILGGGGCVDLKEPANVAACSSSNTCTDDQHKDASPRTDAAVIDSAAPDAFEQPDLPPPDAKQLPDMHVVDTGSADRADAASGGLETGPDTTPTVTEAGQPDTRATPDGATDAAVPATDAPVGDTPPKDAPGADAADLANRDSNPPPIDAAPSAVTTFANGKGVGLMTGYGWVSLGSGAQISSPTCQSGVPITASTPCTSGTQWNSSFPTALCLSGTLESVSAVPTNNWGIQVGVNALGTSGIGQTFRTVTVNAIGVPTAEVRIAIHRSGDLDGVTYCASWTSSSTAVNLLSFNKACWDNTGTFLSAADIPKIDKVGLQVLPLQAQSIPLANLCLQSITFDN